MGMSSDAGSGCATTSASGTGLIQRIASGGGAPEGFHAAAAAKLLPQIVAEGAHIGALGAANSEGVVLPRPVQELQLVEDDVPGLL